MPQFRDYPEATGILPGDAFLIDRPGVGTMYILESATNFSTVYDIAMGFPESLPPNVVLLVFNAVRGFLLPAGLTGSEFSLQTAPSSPVAFGIYQNGVQIGSVDFDTGATTGVASFASDVNFIAGQELRIVSPASLYGASGLSLTFKSTRT